DPWSPRAKGPQPGSAYGRQPDRGHRPLCNALRDLPRDGKGRRVGLAGRERGIPPAAATRIRRGGGRCRWRLVLEDQARHPTDGNARLEIQPHRPANLDARAIPETYGQAARFGRTSVAEGSKLN